MAIGHGKPAGTVRAFYLTPPPQPGPDSIQGGVFYVPKPADDEVWGASPISSTYLHIASLTPFNPKVWCFNNDDPPVQNATPVDSPILAYLTKQTIFGKGGQIVPSTWDFYNDDAPVWQYPVPEKSIALLPATKPPIPGVWNFNNDDPPPWQQPSQRSVALPFVPIINNHWRIDLSDDQLWSLTIRRDQALLVPVSTTAPFANGKWNNYNDIAVWNAGPVDSALVNYIPQTLNILSSPIPRPGDESVWNAASLYSTFISTATAPPSVISSGGAFYVPSHTIDYIWNAAPISSTYLHITPIVQNPFAGQRWKHYDDIIVWNAQSIDAATLTLPKVPNVVNRWQALTDDSSTWNVPSKSSAAIPMLTVGGIIKAKQWHYDNDDSSVWWNWINRDLVVNAVQPKPLVNFYWNSYDDPAFWNIPSRSSQGLADLVTTEVKIYGAFGQAPTKQWHYDLDDSSVWWNWINRDLVVSSIQPKPVIAVTWRFNNDDPPPWQQPSQRSVALPFVPVIADRWRTDIPDDQSWLLTTQRGIAATYQPKPVVPVVWRFNNDDPPPWQQPSQRSVALPFVPVPVNRWRLELSDDQLWSLTAQHNLIFLAPPFVNRWRLDTIEDQLWSLVANRDLSLTATPFRARPYAVTIDDAVTWQWIGRRSSISVVPVIHNSYQPNLAQDQLWGASKYHNLAVTLNIPESFIIRQPSFANDDYGCYQWRVRNPIILSLRWNISLERIAQTATEKRISKASSEARTIDTALEVRKARTTAEVRTANTPTETRIVKAPDEDK